MVYFGCSAGDQIARAMRSGLRYRRRFWDIHPVSRRSFCDIEDRGPILGTESVLERINGAGHHTSQPDRPALAWIFLRRFSALAYIA